MKILLTGATGYIGKRLLIQLLSEGHTVVCSVRDKLRFSTKIYNEAKGNIEIAAVLSREMRGQMAGASGNADIQIEGIKTFVAERVQNTGCKNASHSTALHNQS